MEFIKNIVKIVLAIVTFFLIMGAGIPNPLFGWFVVIDLIIGISILAYCMTYKLTVDELIEKVKNW